MQDQQLGPPEIVAIAAVALFFVATLLPWFGVDVSNDPSGVLTGIDFGTANGWDTGLLWSFVPVLLGGGLLALLLVPRLSPDTALPDLPPFLPLVLGGTAAFLLFVKLLVGTGVRGVAAAEAFGVDVDVTREFGLFLAFLATLGMLAAGVLAFRRDAGAAPAQGIVPPQPF